MTIHDNTPILIGCGLTVQKEKDLQKAKAPIDLLVEAGALALADTGQDADVRAAVDVVGSI
ncbi:MAG: acetyl-CoA acetyltransferase, partial [Alphaproteobacteria bacterium]|nr:acetyl-CoA acetyltransferase [Alphaproteobacteria bacterium]